jgi:hypothetical protein
MLQLSLLDSATMIDSKNLIGLLQVGMAADNKRLMVLLLQARVLRWDSTKTKGLVCLACRHSTLEPSLLRLAMMFDNMSWMAQYPQTSA